MHIKHIRKYLIGIFFVMLILIFYRNFWSTFFQQDEWNGFGAVIALSHGNMLGWLGVVGSYHFVPFSQLFYFLLYKSFGYQAQYFAITSLVLHSVATFLVYLLIYKITKKGILGFIGATLFAVNVNTSQAYLHLAVFPATVTCFIFVVLFMLYVVFLSNRQVLSMKNAIVLSALFLLSVGSREDGLVLIPLFLLWLLLFQRNVLQRKNKWFFLIFGLVISAFLLFRLFLQIRTPHVISVTNDSYWITFFINLVWFAPKIFAQTVVGGNDLLVFIWNGLERATGVPIALNSVIKIFLPMALICIDCIIFLFFTIGILLSKNREKKIIIFGIGWAVAYSILLSAVGRQMDLVEPRYLYFPSFGIILSIVVAAEAMRKAVQKKYKYARIVGNLLLSTGIVMFLFFSYGKIRQVIQAGIVQGDARKSIVGSLIGLYPTIPKKVIIFVRCKDTCHRNVEFGLPNAVVLPFSSGSGYIFLLQYAIHNETAYASFFKKQTNGVEFLWDYGSEGYKEINGYGFGYFIHEELLKQAVQKYHIQTNNIIGLEYNENTFTMKDISSQVKVEINAQ